MSTTTAGASSLPYEYQDEATALPYEEPSQYILFDTDASPKYIVGMFLAVALGAIFFLLSVAYCIRRLRHRRHIKNSNADSNNPEIDDDKIEHGLTIEKWTEKASSCTICALCSHQFMEGEEVCKSPNKFCSHIYHKSCMTNWLHLQNTCPTCNKTYLVEIV